MSYEAPKFEVVEIEEVIQNNMTGNPNNGNASRSDSGN